MLPFRAWGEISPDKNTDRHDTTAGFTPPLLGHWSFAISCPLAPNGTAFSIRFLFVGSSFRFPLPSHARSPSRSCGSLPFEWPLQGRSCTSKSVPMLGVQQKGRDSPALIVEVALAPHPLPSPARGEGRDEALTLIPSPAVAGEGGEPRRAGRG